MIDANKDIVKALSKILPTYYEMVLHSGIKTPCISYMELNNSVQANGDTLGYSTVQFQIKVWGTDIEIIQKKALLIDNALRPLGWRRISTNELYDNQSSMIQKIMTYQALGKENF